MQNAQEQIRTALGVVRKHKVAIARERSIDTPEKYGRHFLVGVSVRVPHITAFVNQDMI